MADQIHKMNESESFVQSIKNFTDFNCMTAVELEQSSNVVCTTF